MTANWSKEAALMAGVAVRDYSACRQLIDGHMGPVHGLAYRMLGNVADAEDITQEAFLRLYKAAADWQPRARIGTWLYRVAYNLCVDRLRHRGRWKEGGDVDELESISAVNADVKLSVEAAMDQLPERQRAAIWLVHFLGESGAGAAEIMDVSPRALESLLSRGRRNLKVLLAEDIAQTDQPKERTGS